ncbi:hypothetical protein ACLMAB_13050 [Brevibacillus laterosporus]
MIQKLRGRRFYLFILFVAILELSMMGLHSLEGKKQLTAIRHMYLLRK